MTVSPPASASANVVQGLLVVSEGEKREALLALIKSQEVKNALVFCNRKRDVATLHTTLKKHGINAGALHGDMSQPARTETLERFKAGEIHILVASDVAARGLDIVDMSHVFNYDVPFSPEDYVHRIGRTGRAGKTGHSFTLATPAEGGLIEAIEKLIGTTIPRIEVPGLEAVALEAGDGRRRGRGGRWSGGGGGRAAGLRATAWPASRAARTSRAARAGAAASSLRRARTPNSASSAARAAAGTAPSRTPSRARACAPGTACRERVPADRSICEPRGERPARAPRGRRGHRRERDDGSAPKGLGDHVPAFLARR